ncbi:YncE family protein [Rhodococcus hoagii]|nr:YncE family protein [Prescottella equi]
MTRIDKPPRSRRGVRLVAGVGAAAVAAATILAGGGTATADSVAATISHGDIWSPHALAIGPDGTRAYVANSGEGQVSVIDTATNAVIGAPFRVGNDFAGMKPTAVAITPNGARAYVTVQTDAGGLVSVVDLATGDVVENIQVGAQPYKVAFSRDGSRAYVTNWGDFLGDGSMWVIDTTATPPATLGHPIRVGPSPTSVAINADGTRAYVTNRATEAFADGAVSVIDLAGKTRVDQPIEVVGMPGAIVISPDGTRAYVTTTMRNGDGRVTVIDTATNAVVGVPIVVGPYPGGVAITPNGTRVYVTNAGFGTLLDPGSVSVIDTTANPPVVTEVAVGRSPREIAITPDGAHAYVTNQSGHSVSVIAIDRAPTLTGAPPVGAAGQSYAHAFTVAGEPAPTVSVTTGSLPTGLNVSPGGILSGTPTTGGRFEFTVTATNKFGKADLPVVLDITGSPDAPDTPAGSLGSLGS